MYTNKREICALAVQRSGHHAILEWILENISGTYVFINNSPPSTNPYNPQVIRTKPDFRYTTNDENLSYEAECQKSPPSPKDLFMYNYESQPWEKIFTPAFIQNRPAWIGSSQTYTQILIVRDALNNIASLVKVFGHNRGDMVTRHIHVWKQHAKEFLGETDILKHKVLISYNKWNLDEDYRKEKADELELTSYTLPGRISKWGQGSSFDGFDASLLERKAELNERWKSFQEDVKYINYFKNDPELTRLSLLICEQVDMDIPDFLASSS